MNSRKTKELKRLAAGLPVVMEKVIQKVPGQTLIDQGVTVNEAGEEIDPEKTYMAQQPKVSNTFNVLKDIYNKGGMDAVNNHCDYIRSIGGDHSPNIPVPVDADWFIEDNVHLVGGGRVHYTADQEKQELSTNELGVAIDRYLMEPDGTYQFQDSMIDSGVRCYIFKKK